MLVCLIVSGTDETEKAVDHQRRFRLTCYFDADSQGGSSASLAVLIGALDPAFDITVMGTSESMVQRVAEARPGATTRVLAPVRNKFDLRGVREHVRVVRELRPDILHVNLDNPWTSQYGLLAGALTRTPMVSVLHLPTPPWRRRQQWMVRPIARRVQAYVCVSADSARFAESVLDLRPGSARVIYNGMPVPSAFARLEPPSGPGTLRIGAVGRLAEQKGLHTLIEAMRLLPHCRLTLVGEGPERPTLEALVRRFSLGDRVEFAGWAAPPWTATWAFDVLAMPSINEGFPLVIVEAMLASIPVVASTVGGIPEIVVPESTGLLVPPGDPDTLAQALRRLADDPQLRRDMGARCRAVAIGQFTDTAMAGRFEALYREVLAARS